MHVPSPPFSYWGSEARLEGRGTMLPRGRTVVSAVSLLVVMVAGSALDPHYQKSPPLLRSPRTSSGLRPRFSQSSFSQKFQPCSSPQYFWDVSTKQCCRSCPAGHFLKAPCTEPQGPSSCQPCHQDTFLSWENHKEKQCARCQICDEGFAKQVVVQNCSNVANTKCGCAPGWFPECSVNHCRGDSPFHCVQCLDCGSLNRQTSSPCSEENTICGNCLPGFHPDKKNSCVPVPSYTTEEKTQPSMISLRTTPGRVTPFPTTPTVTWFHYFLVVPTVLTVLLLLGWGLFYSYRKCPMPRSPAHCPAAGTLQPGPQLYEVMDAVPARRWKEFVRTLGLREAEIEAVEAEIGRFRDQQYEMLKRWRQQQPAGLGAVYAALERMGLEGCAEDLRSRLQRGP